MSSVAPSYATLADSPYLRGLNPEQREAVEHVHGPLLVLAGAGSGKTRVLTCRIANLVHRHQVPPAHIMAVTFTNKAAAEMKERITQLIGQPPKGMWVGTFHGFGAFLLRQHADRLGLSPHFTIVDTDESLRELKRIVEARADDMDPSTMRYEISRLKNALVSPERFRRELAFERATPSGYDLALADIYAAYQASLAFTDRVDFDDLLVKPVELLERDPALRAHLQDRYQFIAIDEYQDTNAAQYRLVELLAAGHNNLMVVGDDDQAIYSWRHANIENILTFERTFPGAKVVRLEQNYRSTGHILAAANAVIRNNRVRKGKTLRTDEAPGDPITVAVAETDFDEARWIVREIQTQCDAAPGRVHKDFAILYRTNAQSRVLEEALRRAQIPYQLVGGLSFYERKEIKDVMAYLRLLANPRDSGAFERVVNYPRRKIGDKAVHLVTAYAKQHKLSLLEAAANADQIHGLQRAAVAGLTEFASLITQLGAEAKVRPASDILQRLIDRLALYQVLADEGPEGADRIENVRELLASIGEFETSEAAQAMDEDLAALGLSPLERFLQSASLIADADTHVEDAEKVTLMTLHASKGLEFPVVFITGLEDGLFPHDRTMSEPSAMEEERRLFYVGITRARERLYLSYAHQRRRGRDPEAMQPSRFLDELPVDLRRLVQINRSDGFASVATERVIPRPHWYDSVQPQLTAAVHTAQATRVTQDDAPAPVERDASQPEELGTLRKGEVVVHPTYGRGVVLAAVGVGPHAQVIVNFEHDGRKVLKTQSAGLRRGS